MEKKTVGQKVKGHFKKHKAKYIVGGACLVVGGTVGVYLGNKGIINIQVEQHQYIDKSVRILTKKGHPGNKVICNETREIFNSQKEASESLGLNSSKLSKHLTGKQATVDGYTFTKMVTDDSQ